MSAERTPQDQRSILISLLVGLTRLSIRYPVATIVVALLAALGSLALSNARMGFRTSRLDLLDPRSEFNRLWIEYLNEFGRQQDAVVVIEGPSRERIEPVVDEIAALLAREPNLFHDVLASVDVSRLKSKGLHYAPPEDLQRIDGFLTAIDPVLRGDWGRLGLGSVCQAAVSAAPQSLTPQTLAEMQGMAKSLNTALAGQYQSPWSGLAELEGLRPDAGVQHFFSADGQMGFLLLHLAENSDKAEFVPNARAIATLREFLAGVQARHTDMKIGLTGLPIIENDEMVSSQSSMAEVSLVSLLGVSLLFIAGFGGWRHPLLAVISLTVGTTWAFGYITLTIGHLNILSSAFAVILIGQGIDFSMYYVARYLEVHGRMRSSGAALLETAVSVGPGIATGAITTAIAFFMAGLTEFPGVAELGIIAGGGILLCWIAGLTLLPAMIHLCDSRWPSVSSPIAIDVRSWIEPLLVRPKLTLSVTMGLTLFLCTGIGHLWYDHNLLHLQADGLQSVDLEQRLLSRSDQNASFALSIAETPEEVQARKDRFQSLPSVKRVEEIATRFPTPEPWRRDAIERIGRRLAGLPDEVPQIPVPRLPELAQVMSALPQMLGALPAAGDLCRECQQAVAAIAALPPAECYARISQHQQRAAGELLAMLKMLKSISDPAPPQPSDLAPALVSRFVGKTGKHLIKVYSKADIWNMAGMEQFVHEVRSVDPRATGNPLQVYEASRQMEQSYEEAALYALAIIIPVVFFDFRSIRYTLLAMLPLALGIAQMFGLMGLLGIPLNPANMIVLPLILGIGIDAGVHVVHDFCSQKGRYRINASTASAVVINSVTNMAGFGSLMIASHQGLQSLGRVLTIGLSCCLFSSLVMVPALLSWLTADRKPADEPSGDEPPGDETPCARARRRQPEEEPVGLLRRFDGPHEPLPSGHIVPRPVRPGVRLEG